MDTLEQKARLSSLEKVKASSEIENSFMFARSTHFHCGVEPHSSTQEITGSIT